MEENQEANNNQKDLEDLDDVDLGPSEDRSKKIKEKYFEACKKGDINYIKKVLNSELVKEVDDSKWTGLLWAVINDFREAVKIIYKKQKEVEEEESKVKKVEDTSSAKHISEIDEAFKKPLNPADNGKYTPLHWSAYKGLDVISSILLNMNCNPLEVDSYGNNALHQAAASNKVSTFKLFMGLGIDLEYKNSRNHMPIDLTTNKAIQNFITKSLSIKSCELCKKLFHFSNKRYLCSINEEVICKNCCTIQYFYETETSNDKDVRDCRCNACYNDIVKAEKDLQAAIDSNNLEKLQQQYEISQKYKICCKLSKSARENLDRLAREKQITEHLDSLKVVPEYKIIEKSVYLLNEMITSAEANKIKLDDQIITRAYLESNRLLAEKELRKTLSNMSVSMASDENLESLTQIVDNAQKCNVDKSYVDVGVDLIEKIKLNLCAKKLLAMFIEYPIREYPVIEVIDPKKKSKTYYYLLCF